MLNKIPILHGLRSRYLTFAVVFVMVMIVATALAERRVAQVSQRNAEALQLRDAASQIAEQFRNAVWSAEFGLHATLISPTPEQEATVLSDLQRAKTALDALLNESEMRRAGLQRQVQALQQRLSHLRAEVSTLLKLRMDPRWTYPALPYLDGTLLESNIAFETAAGTMLAELEFDGGGSYRSPLYGQVAAIRDLWRRMILNFRAVMIRFAGLHDVDPSDQEANIEQLHTVIRRKLEELAANPAIDDGVASEDAISTMSTSSENWFRDFQNVKKLRTSANWRADIGYIDRVIRPAVTALYADLNDLEQAISSWSASNVAKVEDASRGIGRTLWVLLAAILVATVLGYMSIDRWLLRPIARVTRALARDEDNANVTLVPISGLAEVQQLTRAFAEMRRQVRERQKDLEHQAMHDVLTGLPNRALLRDRLVQATQRSRRERSSTELALLILDLDRFKEINDTLGHQVGDQILQQVAARLETLLRQSDTVARLGGDEFAILAPETSSEHASELAEKIIGTIDTPFDTDGRKLYLGVSIGIALFPEHGLDPDTLIQRADVAMYAAKRSGKGAAIYDPKRDPHSLGQLALVSELRNALLGQELQLHYQPKIDMATGQVDGVEALLRWPHAEHGVISPETIVRMAEHNGLITQLTDYVLRRAVNDCARWRHRGIHLTVAVNLSALDLQDPQLPIRLRHILDFHGLPSERLTLEITESAMMTDLERARSVLAELDSMGVQLAIDDFGTGFSSLGYLKVLPMDELKIDKSFVLDMLNDENDAIIVRSTIDLAHNLGLRVVAEGVESQEMLERLREQRCDVGQGFHFGEPMPADAMLTWLFRRAVANPPTTPDTPEAVRTADGSSI